MVENINKKAFPRTIDGKIVSINERLDFVYDMFGVGSELDNFYLQFNEYLHNVNTDSMSKREKQTLYHIWEKNFKPCTLACDYLTAYIRGNCFDIEGLKRLYNDPRRKFNIINMSRLKRSNTNEEIEDYSDYEFAEYKSLKKGYTKYGESAEEKALIDTDEENLVNIFTDKLERQIAELVIQGKTQKQICKTIGLTKSKLETILHVHMADSYSKRTRPEKYPKLSTETKACKRCGQEKSVDLFGSDSRKKDGKQSICKSCDTMRKK